MGFKGVYRSLTELFPQVDPRILKAVAIEQPKNADSAAEVVLSEILPYLSRQAASDKLSREEDCNTNGVANRTAEHQAHANSLGCHQAGMGETGTYSEPSSIVNKDACKTTDAVHNFDSAHQEKAQSSTTLLLSDRTVDSNLQGNIESEELILLVRPQHQKDSSQFGTHQTSKVMSSALTSKEITDPCQICVTTETEASFGKFQDNNYIRVEHEQISQVISTTLEPKKGDYVGCLATKHKEQKESDGPSSNARDTFLSGTNSETELCSDSVDMEVKNSLVEETQNSAEVDLQSEFSGTSFDSCNNSKFNQEIKIDILDGVVEAAKTHKKTLFSEVESIMNKMREVELQEKIAEQAKEEAASAGMETLAKMEELKQMLSHAKEANDMHAGEVYGEKSILVTEVRELQVRLLGLSDERDKALAILDEMHQTLEARLAAAEEVKKTAKKQNLEKEESARNALAEQEAIMEKVVQESKILQQEAEENAKLREFLMDRGRVVDTLQGEISVICHDVRLLKEKFDERVPLSKSISSCQTSCILASSGSSLKSMVSDLGFEPMETSTCPNRERSSTSSISGRSPIRSLTSSIDGQSPTSRKEKGIVRGQEGERIISDDDDWEFFE